MPGARQSAIGSASATSELSDPPVIGICAVRERARWSFWDQDAHLVADTYVAAVQRAGGIAVLLPIDIRASEVLLDRLDGLLLIGGADVDPASYGAEPDPATEATYPDRDRFEIALLLGALQRKLPLLAICRGMQLLNVALGGTLEQNLIAEDGSNPHRKVIGTFDGTEHEVRLDRDSLAARAVGEELHIARCHHHQAVLKLGQGLIISGRAASDGVTEAIETTDGSWALGVQWHPETDDRTRLFAALCDAAAAARAVANAYAADGQLAKRTTLDTTQATAQNHPLTPT
jgi:putative glutamine amidotransferase